jgi:hypothetical protein
MLGAMSAALAASCCCISTVSAWQAESGSAVEKALHEPVFRVASMPSDDTPATTPPSTQPETIVANATAANPAAPVEPTVVRHPLDPAIELAKARLEAIRGELFDYQAIMVKRERIGGELKKPEFMKVKFRNRRTRDGVNVPFSVYMRFLKPENIRGREVIYVEGQNNGKLVAHDTGLAGLITVYLDPTGPMAMQNSRYPIYDAGLENLVSKLIEKAERDKAAGDCQVEFIEDAKINDRPCTKIRVTHAEKREPYDFNVAEVFIDNELQVPIRYAAYTWPRVNGAEPELLEEYTYLNLELNPGFTDKDFDPSNPEYDYR